MFKNVWHTFIWTLIINQLREVCHTFLNIPFKNPLKIIPITSITVYDAKDKNFCDALVCAGFRSLRLPTKSY